MNELTKLKTRCEEACFMLLKESLDAREHEQLREFVKQDRVLQEVIEETISYVIYDLELRPLLLQVMMEYQQRGYDA